VTVLSNANQFALAKRCGFDGIDASPLEDPAAARAQARLARQLGAPGLAVFGIARSARPFNVVS